MHLVCETDNACIGFPLLGAGEDDDDNDSQVSNMTCYKGGETVFNNHQMCDVTSTFRSTSDTDQRYLFSPRPKDYRHSRCRQACTSHLQLRQSLLDLFLPILGITDRVFLLRIGRMQIFKDTWIRF
jgi:hypothetical protein